MHAPVIVRVIVVLGVVVLVVVLGVVILVLIVLIAVALIAIVLIAVVLVVVVLIIVMLVIEILVACTSTKQASAQSTQSTKAHATPPARLTMGPLDAATRNKGNQRATVRGVIRVAVAGSEFGLWSSR